MTAPIRQTGNCTCERCPECRGGGYVWYALDGTYLGSRRCDDLDELDVCEECNGSGILDVCDYCHMLEEEEREWEE